MHLDTVKSTQIEARSHIAQGVNGPFWVTAKEQTQGRGRSGRAWQSAYGNYSGSLVLPLPPQPQDAPKYSMIMALGLSLTFEKLGLSNISIKWPNDVLVEQRKLAGILVEAEGAHLIIGTGVNLISTPEDINLEGRAVCPASLDEWVDIGYEAFHEVFEQNVQIALTQFDQFGFDPIRRSIKSQLLVRENMVFDDGRAEYLVKPHDIGANGQLIVEVNGVTKELYAGDLLIKEVQHGSSD